MNIRSFLHVAVAVWLVSAGQATAQSVRIPGTSVSLTPPPGFQMATRFSGFERLDAGASIVVTEMAAPFEEVAAGMRGQAAAEKGRR